VRLLFVADVVSLAGKERFFTFSRFGFSFSLSATCAFGSPFSFRTRTVFQRAESIFFCFFPFLVELGWSYLYSLLLYDRPSL